MQERANRMREELRRLRGDREGGSRQVQERVRRFERELADIESALERDRGQRGPRGRERGPGIWFAPERMRPDRPTRPSPPFVDPPFDPAQRRVRHLEIAAENLDQAGLHEQADRVRREVAEMQRALAEELQHRREIEVEVEYRDAVPRGRSGFPGPRPPEPAARPAPPEQLHREVAELREEVHRLHEHMREMREHLERMTRHMEELHHEREARPQILE